MSDYRAYYQGEEIQYSMSNVKDVFQISYEGLTYDFKVIALENSTLIQNLETGDSHYIVQNQTGLTLNGKFIDLNKRKQRESAEDSNALGDLLTPMPGKIIKVYVKEAQEDQVGDKLFSMEAMKMEHTIVAPMNGIVGEVLFSEGEQVDAKVEVVQLSLKGENGE